MKVYKTGDIRNVALIGNAGSGKSTFAENMLLKGGKISRRGTINAKSTVSDYRAVEHEQGGSVYSSVMNTEWEGVKINILDSPGAIDFVGGAVSSLSMADTAIMFINSQNGIEVGTEIHWRQAQKLNKPIMIVANHLNHDKTNFEKTIDEAKEKFGKGVILVQYPVNQGPDFNAIIDVIMRKMYTWDKDGENYKETDIPEEEVEKTEKIRSALTEAAAESDDALMEKFFETETLTEDEMRAGILAGIQNGELYPVMCAAADKNMGTKRILDFIKNAMPSPDIAKPSITKEGEEIKFDSEGKKSIFIFKVSIEEHLGEVLYFRVMSGTISESEDLINTISNSKERISQIFVSNGKTRENATTMHAGDIGATVKLKSTKGEHTLAEKGTDYIFENIKYPNPKYRAAIKAIDESDEEKLGEYLHRLRDEDPTYILEYSKELKQLILHSQGEHHLNTLKWHLDNIYKIQTEFIS